MRVHERQGDDWEQDRRVAARAPLTWFAPTLHLGALLDAKDIIL